jgi:hypothetical protein
LYFLLLDLVSLETSHEDNKAVDIYAIGFEEMVDLDAKNIMNASGENAREWAEELAKTLNRDTKYCLVTFHQLVGVCLYVFVRPELASGIREVLVEEVKTGMGGTTGNKGAVAISFTYAASSFCFLCSHFAAGQTQVQERNNDYSEAVKRIAFSNVSDRERENSLSRDIFCRAGLFCPMTMCSGVETSTTGLTWTGRRLRRLSAGRSVAGWSLHTVYSVHNTIILCRYSPHCLLQTSCR